MHLRKGLLPLVLCAVLLVGCSDAMAQDTKQSEDIVTTLINTEANGHAEQLHDYDSAYTVCYRNKDNTYSTYIFASPIQYKTEEGYAFIDNQVIDAKKDGFAYENKANEVKTYFPRSLSECFRVEKGEDSLEFKPEWAAQGFSDARKTVFTNMYGDSVSAVIYEREDMDLAFYPTSAGIKAELVLKKKPEDCTFSFTIKSSSAYYENKQNGYIVFSSDGKNKSIIHGPLVSYSSSGGQLLDVTAETDISRKKGNSVVTVTVNQSILGGEGTVYPIKLDPSFEMYTDAMPDSTVYENSGINRYLADYAVVGNHPVTGESWHYLRLRLNWFMYIDEGEILNAVYSVRDLYSPTGNGSLRLLNMGEQWSSTEILWRSRREECSEYLICSAQTGKYFEFKVTDFVKKSFADASWLEESHGLLLKGIPTEDYSILATSDNTLYPPCLRIDTISEPDNFKPQEKISP